MFSAPWPESKKFVFTVFDDTDFSTVDNVGEVYNLLRDLGFRTTKSVWPIKGQNIPTVGGITCEDKDYLSWVLDLKKQGFEIGFHNATYHSSFREDTIKGIEKFREFFGEYPKSMANHADCEEGIYWGNARLTGVNEKIYNFVTFNKKKNVFRGHVENDRFFWGDICKERIKYVRSFVFPGINTFKICPFMPYHDPQRPYVNYWFASSNGCDLKDFNKCISEGNQDRLEEEGGVCIMYTHFAKGFQQGNKINPAFFHF